MKNFLNIILSYSIPIGIYFLLVFTIDPYNYFNNYFKTTNKEKISQLNNKALYEVLSTKSEKFDKIIVGDSRVGGFDENYILKKYQKDFNKIVLPAAKLNEINELIFFMIDEKNVNEIILGINFNMFNEFAYSSRASEILNIYKKPTHYIFNFNIFKLSLKILNDYLFISNISDSKPLVNKEVFWEQHLSTRSLWQYSRYKYPNSYEKMLLDLDNYCEINNIKLSIILLPHHYDDIQILKDSNLIESKKQFYILMKSLNAKVINYDYYHENILDKNNFTDPVHYSNDIGTLIVDEIFTNSFNWGVVNKEEDFIELRY
tara:strand:- start:4706 stop:5656 length:951 start_codon:yes stop_codon:yes gene_type:complete